LKEKIFLADLADPAERLKKNKSVKSARSAVPVWARKFRQSPGLEEKNPFLIPLVLEDLPRIHELKTNESKEIFVN
jgi:hypothetical protein